jgi:hypothetical protein
MLAQKNAQQRKKTVKQESTPVSQPSKRVDVVLLERAIGNLSDRFGLCSSDTRTIPAGCLGNVLISLDWRYLERAGVGRLRTYIKLAAEEGLQLRFEHNAADGLVIVGREFGMAEEATKRHEKSVSEVQD